MLKLNHKNLNVWKLSISFIKDIYKLTEKFPKSEIFGITNQMRRASVSIASNIAEGASRKSAIERKRFYEISRSSIVEIDTQLEISSELEFIKLPNIKIIEEKLIQLFAMMSGLIEKTT
jgi:four helix bundle protein